MLMIAIIKHSAKPKSWSVEICLASSHVRNAQLKLYKIINTTVNNMIKSFKIFQTDSLVKILNPETTAVNEYPIFSKPFDKQFQSKSDAEKDLSIYLKQHPDDKNEYTILEIYSN